MNDAEFLQWIHDRILHVYKVYYSMDWMHRLRKVIREFPDEKLTEHLEKRIEELKEENEELKEQNKKWQEYFNYVRISNGTRRSKGPISF